MSLTANNPTLLFNAHFTYMKLFQQQLNAHDLTEHVNVIQVSDHGMTAVTPPHFINITQYLTNGTYEWAGASPAIQIIPHEGKYLFSFCFTVLF